MALDDEIRTSPLHSRHVASGAKMADFAGWSMPLEHAGRGVRREHEDVRTAVGVFDVSHLGKLSVTGPGARALLDSTLTSAVGRLGPGRAQYSLCCDDATGGVVDDLFVYVRGDEDVLLVPNAANAGEVARRLREVAPGDVEVRDAHTDHAVLAVQGPRSDEVLQALGLPSGHEYLSFVEATWRGAPVVVCRTGYTGERGYELLPRWEEAGELWDALLAAAAEAGGGPAGLGARDTLRTEMGYALHGHELSLDVTPVQARLGWAVAWDKPAFWGRDVLLREREAGAARRAWGLRALERGVPRAGMPVRAATADGPGEVLGTTTSGTYSPTLGEGVALALLAPSVGAGDEVLLEVRGRFLRCAVQRPPFVQPSAAS
ncbi:aminomethyltransferase [Kineococcus xinjiangensis]|uniref:aminomethyltransferase n=1 Tax=Kineococcus xinjiangensis TaxID=512762 RepID=A0A2S6IM60_9ACTN|nr:glycine cleavage system aminomethyltransferase GcvT [Kineococcus xinjiangensis]PPK95324.1 aminomethyltransferase [Kineococcus xinjiangensis]